MHSRPSFCPLPPPKFLGILLIFATATLPLHAADPSPEDSFKVMSYNVRNFLVMDRNGDGAENEPKPRAEKEAVYQIISEEAPDILGLIEVGGRDFLEEIRGGLRARGMDYPYDELIQGVDERRHIGVLSRFPIVARDPHTAGEFHAENQRMRALRGFIEIDIQIAPRYLLKTYVAHLKSKRSTESIVNPDRIRLEEARLLRKYIREDLDRDPNVNLLLMGDFNDTPESETLKAILEDPRHPLFDLCPRNPRGHSGTYYHRPERKFERIDYILVSPGLKHEYIQGSARLRDDDIAWKASDHFSIQARFKNEELRIKN